MPSISFGTTRTEDLVPAFLEELVRRNRGKYLRLFQEYNGEDYYCLDADGNLVAGREETAQWLLEDLFEALDDVAPDGYYFGAHPGDGADFGFWRSEDTC